MPSNVQLPPPSLTPWSMFVSADHVVQAVICLLLLASVVTWTILLVKGAELIAARRSLARTLRVTGKSADLPAIGDNAEARTAWPFAAAATAEIEASRDLPAEGAKDRVALRLHRIEHAMVRRIAHGTGILASVGSCGPFIGLFGTVWGIMNSFVGISRAQTTSLAVVAPGIAEALLATACGLVAAIPAVLVYNLFARAIAGYRAQLGDLSANVLMLASRQVDRAIPAAQLPIGRVRPVLVRGAAE